MKQLFVNSPRGNFSVVDCKPNNEHLPVWDILSQTFGINQDNFYIIHNGKTVTNEEEAVCNGQYHIMGRLVGGKGGFGSMLRAIGAQIEKTTSREACRDLSGRRMRDVNNEKKLKEWVAKQAEREKEKERKKQERLERRKAEPRHHFDDPEYEQQKMQVTENLEDALQEGLQKAVAGSSTAATARVSRKRKTDTADNTKIKRACEWLGVNMEELSDLSSESDDDDSIRPGTSGTSCDPGNDSGNASNGSPRNSDSDGTSDSGVESATIGNLSKQTAAATLNSSPTVSQEQMDIDSGSQSTDCGAKKQDLSPEHMQTDSDSQKAPPCVPSTSAQSVEKEKQKNREIELENYNSAQELEEAGLESLKAALMSRGLKCGGTLKERAMRLFSVKGLKHEEIDPSLFTKSTKGRKK